MEVLARRDSWRLFIAPSMQPSGIVGRLPPCIKNFRVCSARTRLGRNSKGQLRVLCYQYGGESESGLGPAGSSDNWRCILLDKLSAIEPLEGPWHTAPNHSRPASCIVDPDIDAGDYPERDPQ